jgi:cytochrome c oxidase cbb3-type subunit 4
MSGIWGHLAGVWIVVLMLVFLGIWYWAWRPRHKDTFDALARVPMLEDPVAPEDRKERNERKDHEETDRKGREETVPHAAGERTP